MQSMWISCFDGNREFQDSNSSIFLVYDLWYVLNPTETLSGVQFFFFTLEISKIEEPTDVLWMKHVSIAPCANVMFAKFANLRHHSKKLNAHILLCSVALFFDVMRSFEKLLQSGKLIPSTYWIRQILGVLLKTTIGIDERDDSRLSLDKS